MTSNQTTPTNEIALLIDFNSVRSEEIGSELTNCAYSVFWPDLVIDALEKKLSGTVTVKYCYGSPAASLPSDWDEAEKDSQTMTMIHRNELTYRSLQKADFTLCQEASSATLNKPVSAQMAIDCLCLTESGSPIEYIAVLGDPNRLEHLFQQIKRAGKHPVLLSVFNASRPQPRLEQVQTQAVEHISYDKQLINNAGPNTLRSLIKQLRCEGTPRSPLSLATIEPLIRQHKPQFKPEKLGFSDFPTFVSRCLPADCRLRNGRIEFNQAPPTVQTPAPPKPQRPHPRPTHAKRPSEPHRPRDSRTGNGERATERHHGARSSSEMAKLTRQLRHSYDARPTHRNQRPNPNRRNRPASNPRKPLRAGVPLNRPTSQEKRIPLNYRPKPQPTSFRQKFGLFLVRLVAGFFSISKESLRVPKEKL